MKAEKYLHENFDGLYPALAKAVQNKRAVYFSLTQMNGFVHELKNLGKINHREERALVALNEKRLQKEMLHAPESDIPEARKMVLKSELHELIGEDDLSDLIYNKSEEAQIDSGDVIYR